MLFAVGLLVVLVSLPRLSVFAMQENETDALALVRTLAQVEPRSEGEGARVIGDLDLDRSSLRRHLRSHELTADGAHLERYGYLFDLCIEEGQRVLRAWPTRFGETGRRAFVASPAGLLSEHANGAGVWSGPASPPEGPWAKESGWRPVPKDADYR